jgi:NAD(P)H-flavin reductase
MQEEWMKEDNMDVYLTIDREEEGWDGHVGFVPNYVTELNLPNTQTAVLCGPPIMIHFTLDGLKKLGFQDNQVYTTLEMRMKCGIGKCGRCNVGDKFVCKDGPVFSFEELATMTGEY